MVKYLKSRMSPGLVSIYSSRTILQVSAALLGVFLPIFLYKIFDFSFSYVIIYFLIRNVMYSIFVAPSCKYIMNKIGLNNSIKWSILWGTLFYSAFYILETQFSGSVFNSGQTGIALILIATVIFDVLFKVMYWVPVHTDITVFSDKGDRGKQLSVLSSAQVILGALMPIIGGFILLKYQYDVLFIIAIVVFLLSLIPLSTLPNVVEKFSWSIGYTWKQFFSKKRRNMIVAYMGDGAEGEIGVIIWPIFIWILLDGNYLKVGILSSLIVVVTIIVQLFTGDLADKMNKKKMLKYGTFLYSVGWIIKMFIVTTVEIFVISAYHSLVKIFTRTSFDTMNYDLAADQGHYVDEYTVLREMAISIGRVIMDVFIIIALVFFSIQWTFILAAVATLIMNYISKIDNNEKLA